MTNSKEELRRIELELPNVKDEVRYEQLVKQRMELQKDIEKYSGKSEMFEYFLDTGDILYKYYEVQERIQRGDEPAV